MEVWLEWMRGNEALLLWMAALSAFTFVGTLVLVPVLLSRMPADYFVGAQAPSGFLGRLPPWSRWFAVVLKNLLGTLLLAMGFIMLFVPGQGVLTMLLGLALTSFPGKRRLEQRIAALPRIRRSIDWIRRRNGRPSLRFDEPGRTNRSEG